MKTARRPVRWAIILTKLKTRERSSVYAIKEDPEKIRQRMCLSEHPFGTVKWYDGAHYLLCKGKQKATAELGLSFLVYNLKRAINMVGTKAILAAIRE